MRLGVSAAIVDGEIVEGDVAIEDGKLSAVALSPAATGALAVPGFVDLQVNGFAGVDLISADAAGYRRVGDALAATGVTAYQPTFISSPVDTVQEGLATLSNLDGTYRGPHVLPAHLEGPFLSKRHHGAHDARHLLEPDITLAGNLLDAGPVGLVTLAPELPGGLELVEHLVGRGVVVALGHTDADAATASEAFDRGAAAVTHIFNAMRRFQPRDPGLSVAAMTRDGVVVMAIVDGIHLAPETVRLLLRAARGRFALVTDAIEAAGLGDGVYRLSDRVVNVRGAEARLQDGTLAGSVLSMDAAVRNVVELGAPIEVAVEAATSVPARLIRRADIGSLRVGAAADVAVLDRDLRVARTLVGGHEVYAAR